MDASALTRSNRVLHTLSAGHRVLLRATDEQGLLESICNVLVDDGRYPIVWIGYADHDERKSIRRVAHAGSEGGFLDDAPFSWDDRQHGVTAAAIRDGRPATGRDADSDPLLAHWRSGARGRRGAIGAFPLRIGETIIGKGQLGLGEHSARLDALLLVGR